MNRLLLIFLTLFPAVCLAGQPGDSLQTARALAFERNAYRLLFGWGTKSMVFGGIETALNRPEAGSVHAVFGAINTGISLVALSDLRKWDGTDPGGRMARLNRVALINAGLDLGYVGAGWWLASTADGNDVRRSVGQAAMIQGGWLFIFDVYLSARSRKLQHKGITAAPARNGTGISLHWK